MDDITLKVYRIIYNHTRLTSLPPSVDKLTIKTGRRRADILRILGELAAEGCIEWDPARPDVMRTIRAPGNPVTGRRADLRMWEQ